MKKIIKEYKEQIKYFLTNKKYIVPVIFVAILSYGFAVTHYSIGVDDLCFDRYVNGTYILSAKRWGTWLLYNILNIKEFTPFWLDFIVATFMVVIAIVMSAFIRKQVGDKIKGITYTIFSCLFISNPLVNQFYIYQSTNLAIVISNLMVIICGIVVFENYFKENKNIIHILSALVLMVPISMYESCAQTYLVLIFIAIFIKVQDKNTNIKKLVGYFSLNIGLLIIGVLLYYISGMIVIYILKKFKILQSNFAYMSIIWNQNSFKQLDIFGKIEVLNSRIIKPIVNDSFKYLPITIMLTSNFIVILIELVNLIKTSKISRIIAVLGMITSNFVLIILQGDILYRTEFSMILTTAFVCSYIYQILNKKKCTKYIINVIVLLLVIFQTRTLNQYFYNDYKRYEREKTIANDIGTTIQKQYDYKNKYVVYVTSKANEERENKYQLNKDNRLSVYNWGMEGFRERGTEITKFINNFGYNLKNAPDKESFLAKNRWEKLDEEQKKKTIIELENTIIVNLDNYDLF